MLRSSNGQDDQASPGASASPPVPFALALLLLCPPHGTDPRCSAQTRAAHPTVAGGLKTASFKAISTKLSLGMCSVSGSFGP